MAAAEAKTRNGEGGARRRSAARLAAVQALYQMAMTGAPADEVVSQFVARGGLQAEAGEGELVAPDRRFFETLVLGVDARRESLDDTIRGSLAEDWPFERLEILVRLILEAAAFEITGLANVPPRVAIDEYMNVANAFYGGAEPGFVNGVLDAIARNLRPAEMTPPAP